MRMRLKREALATLMATIVSASSSYSEPMRVSQPALQACIVAQAQKPEFSGVVSARWRDSAADFVQGQVSDPGSPPIDIGAQFNIGSAGKMFTALAIGQLIDAGKIKLDDPIGKYVTGLTAATSRVTVQQLLNHSSGLGNYFAPENLSALKAANTLTDLLPLVSAETPAFEPGTRFSYSDSGFLLLGLLIEHASELSYDDYVRRNIFTPARMGHTTLQPMPISARAQGMTRMPSLAPPAVGNGPRLLLRPGDVMPKGPLRPAQEASLLGGPAGGAYSTAADMQAFFAALLGGKLLHQDTLNLLTSPQSVADQPGGGPSKRGYGLGFGVGEYEGHRWFGHNGGAPGVNAETFVFPDDQISLVVLSNRDPPVASVMFQGLRAALFDSSPQPTCAHLTSGQLGK